MESTGRKVNPIEAVSKNMAALLKKCFDLYDEDGSGEIDPPELENLLQDVARTLKLKPLNLRQ